MYNNKDRAVEEWNNWTTQENLLCCVVARPRWFKVSLEMNCQWQDSNYKSPCQKQPLSQPCHNPAPQIVFGKTLWASFRTGKIALTFTREETYVGYDVTGPETGWFCLDVLLLLRRMSMGFLIFIFQVKRSISFDRIFNAVVKWSIGDSLPRKNKTKSIQIVVLSISVCFSFCVSISTLSPFLFFLLFLWHILLYWSFPLSLYAFPSVSLSRLSLSRSIQIFPSIYFITISFIANYTVSLVSLSHSIILSYLFLFLSLILPFFKNCPFPASFFFFHFCLFNTVDNKCSI